jgi:iron complex transport system ATP-binding protein
MTTASSRLGLVAEGVSFAFDSNPAIIDVSLRLEPGDTLALAGPNGSGKTTLLSLFTGVRRPVHGRVTLDQRPVQDLSPRQVALRVAVVSQQMYPQLSFTVEAMVAMGRTPHSSLLGNPTMDDHRAIERALHITETGSLARRRFSELSGGEQRRVMLAMALAQETDYLLLDEPTAHLDLRHQHQILELLGRLQNDRTVGILAVMHDLNLAALYFSRLALLDGGRLTSMGPVHEVLTRAEDLAIFRAPLTLVEHPHTHVPQVLLDPPR